MKKVYPPFEFVFYNFWDESKEFKLGALQNSNLQHQENFDQNVQSLKVNPWFLKYGLDIEEAKDFLPLEQIIFEIQKKHQVTFLLCNNESKLGLCKNEPSFPSQELILFSIHFQPDF